MGGNEQRQPTVVCTATVKTFGIFPVNSRSRFDPLPTARALKFVPLLFLSERSPVLAQFSQIRVVTLILLTGVSAQTRPNAACLNLFQAKFSQLIPTITWSFQMYKKVFFFDRRRNCKSGLWTLPSAAKWEENQKETKKKSLSEHYTIFFWAGVMNCNKEMIIMMIEIISGIIKGQSQDAIMGDINYDLWLIFCKAGSVEREAGHEQRMCPNVFAERN